MAKKILLIVGSTRQARIGDQIAEWVAAQAGKNTAIELEVVDLKEWKLPLFEKPYSPQYAPKLDDDIQPWADKIASGDGFIFVTAEYNRGIPAALKSAIDHLYQPWVGKPAAIVSYGYVDGGKSATRHLHDVLDWLKVSVVEPTVAVQLNHGIVDSGIVLDKDVNLASYSEGIQAAVAALAKA